MPSDRKSPSSTWVQLLSMVSYPLGTIMVGGALARIGLLVLYPRAWPLYKPIVVVLVFLGLMALTWYLVPPERPDIRRVAIGIAAFCGLALAASILSLHRLRIVDLNWGEAVTVATAIVVMIVAFVVLGRLGRSARRADTVEDAG